MVTTRSQEKQNAQTPVGASTIEVLITPATRTSPITSSPLPTTRSTRSTPRGGQRRSVANQTQCLPGPSVDSSSDPTPGPSLESYGSPKVSNATLPQRLKDSSLLNAHEPPTEGLETPESADDQYLEKDHGATVGSSDPQVRSEKTDDHVAPAQMTVQSHQSELPGVQQGSRKRRRSGADLDEVPQTTAKAPTISFSGSGVTSLPDTNSLNRSISENSTESTGVPPNAVPGLESVLDAGEIQLAVEKCTSNADHHGSIQDTDDAARPASSFAIGAASTPKAPHANFVAQATATPLGMSFAFPEGIDVEVESQTEAGSAVTWTGASYTTAPEEQSSVQHVQATEESVPTLIRRKHKKLSSHSSKQESHYKVPVERPKMTALQQFRNNVLNSRERTTHWAPGGARRTRFVGA
ncbi:hypothetical protein PV10_07504 [Exophiala mesophila]|uniref:Uncharacterized protein n=1 Tax=Exophiala mesophila TaxID=212818 RepID=A0A0D1ZTP6_EXOME|nr:uncharacterized protein PV10_07504 [Exophiala mesophila]KIV90173.1 hypothetical protein PV10_07504 [Exophiala mesophila]